MSAARSPARRRFGIAAAITVVVLLVAHGALWLVATGQLAARWPATVMAVAERGWAIEGGPPRRTGWPWAAAVEIPDFVVTGRFGGIPVRYTASRIDLAVTPFRPFALVATPNGAQTFEATGSPPVTIEAVRSALVIPLRGDDPYRFSVAEWSAISDAGALHIANGYIEVMPDLLQTRISGRLDGAALGPASQGSARLAFTAHIEPPLAPKASAAATLEAWRAAGGHLTVVDANIEWGAAIALIEGNLNLDPRLQPVFAGTIAVPDPGQALDSLATARVLSPGQANAARAVLQLLGRARGGPAPLPLTIRDGTFRVANFALVRLSPIDWAPP